MTAQNPALEAAIVAAPDDLAARMVYGDWLQAQGDPRGEWAAIRAGLDAEPNNLALHSAAVTFEGDHKADLFGAGAKAIARAYVGWRGGFVDELRIQPASMTAAALRALFDHPTVRFVRHIALGALQRGQLVAAIDAMVAAKLPLLDELVIVDALAYNARGELDGIAKLPITKLSLSGVWLVSPMPRLRELTVLAGDGLMQIARWIEGGGCKQLEKLTIVEPNNDTPPDMKPVLGKAGSRAKLVVMTNEHLFEPKSLTAKNPLLALAKQGREAIRHIPMAGCALYNAGSYHLTQGKPPAAAIPMLDIAATLPTHLTGTWQLANAAIAHERSGDLMAAELRGREALLYSPGEPNYFAIVIDALRRTNRHAEALKLLPRAKRAMAKPPKDAQRDGDRACLLDCTLLLAQLGKYDEALALVAQFSKRADKRIYAVLALLHLAARKLGKARTVWKRAAGGDAFPVFHHAHAAIAAHDGKTAEAKKALAEAKRMGYGDMHWIEGDAVLGKLLAKPKRRR